MHLPYSRKFSGGGEIFVTSKRPRNLIFGVFNFVTQIGHEIKILRMCLVTLLALALKQGSAAPSYGCVQAAMVRERLLRLPGRLGC